MNAFLPTACLLLLALPAAAQVTVYRCTDAQGRVLLGDAPCPRGQRQEVRQLPAPKPAPARAPAANVATPATAAPSPPEPMPEPEPGQAPGQRPLYECVAPNGERYASTTPEGTARWVSVWSLDIPVATSPSTSLAITGGDVRIGPSGIRMTAPLRRAWWPDNAVVLVRDRCE